MLHRFTIVIYLSSREVRQKGGYYMSITNTLETYKLIGIKEGERSMLELVLELSKQLQEQGKGIEELDKVLRRYFTNGCN